MTIPGSAPFAAAPYGAQPVIPVVGPEGGPYNVAGPLPLTLLPSAGRTGTTVSATQVNSGYKGLYLNLSVSANPGGAQTLELQLTGIDPVTGVPFVVLKMPASATPGGVSLLYPGLSGAAVEGVSVTRNLHLPASWYVGMVHSGAGNWIYTVTGVLLP